ncbi:MAG: phosphoribosylanthranilate isomerase [Cytophagaceae bacterium]|nr:phosphoribosylanthranilate isomerase [Gemmatimonadaceae bacterium]
MPEFKFCGLTRAEDVAHAVTLGAHYLGFILAPSPRQRSIAQFRALVASLGATPATRVGVFVSPTTDELARAVEALSLGAVQVHGTLPMPVAELRAEIGASVWCVMGVSGAVVEPGADLLAADADVLLFDTSVAGRTGGSGRAFDWAGVRASLEAVRGRARIALAGGLGSHNVADAIQALAPDIVDVSSGIERTPGVKDHGMMTAFASAVRGVVPA